MNLRPATFSIDTLGDLNFDGYTTGGVWNGWARPYFTFDQAQKVVEAFNSTKLVQGDEVKASYDAERDTFCFFFEAERESDEFAAVELEGQKVYPIGAGCWIWEFVNEQVNNDFYFSSDA